MVRVTQLSDLHFSTSEERSHGGFGYDIDDVWDAVHAHAFPDGGDRPDFVAITGDVADRGMDEEYVKAAGKLARLPVPANACPGNHDFHVPFEARLPRLGLTMSRTLRVGPWLFLFADSNFEGRERDANGVLRDRPDRVMHKARLGHEEMARLSDAITATDAEHAFLWVHHPPHASGGFSAPDYDAELAELFRRHPTLRGAGAGHTHTDTVTHVEGRPVFTCPAFTINLDLMAKTLLPPGYRTYDFGDDGSIRSTCHLLDDPRWPRHPLPEPAVRWLMEEITYEEMRAQLAHLLR